MAAFYGRVATIGLVVAVTATSAGTADRRTGGLNEVGARRNEECSVCGLSKQSASALFGLCT